MRSPQRLRRPRREPNSVASNGYRLNSARTEVKATFDGASTEAHPQQGVKRTRHEPTSAAGLRLILVRLQLPPGREAPWTKPAEACGQGLVWSKRRIEVGGVKTEISVKAWREESVKLTFSVLGLRVMPGSLIGSARRICRKVPSRQLGLRQQHVYWLAQSVLAKIKEGQNEPCWSWNLVKAGV